MTNDIHEMYAEKQKKYQDYLVEKRVHEQKLSSALEALKTEITNMCNNLANNEDELSKRLLDTLNKYNNDTALNTASTVANMQAELQEIGETLEEQIRKALA